jgi:hypothetical protein
MTIKFVEATTNVITNNEVLRDGVESVKVLEARRPTLGEDMDYTPFIPWGCFLSSVEVYANGAQNFFVRTIAEGHMEGYLIRRPLTK